MPAGFVHPLSIAALEALGIDHEGLQSKSWDEFADTAVDVAITLCDSAAREVCPAFPGSPIRAHWPLIDPVMAIVMEEARPELAHQVARTLLARMSRLVEIPFEKLGPADIKDRLDELAKLEVD